VAAVALAAGRRRERGFHRTGGERAPRGVPRCAVTDEADFSVESLLGKYASDIKAIRRSCGDCMKEKDDTYFLRFAIEHKGDVIKAVENVKEVAAWRSGKGKKIVDAATEAVAKALEGGGWNNAPVLAAAPYSAKIGKYLTGSQIVVVSLSNGDLLSCIRAGVIDGKAMMDEVAVDELVEFFLYAREVNFIVAEARTRSSGNLIKLLAANDLSGVSSFPDSRFQEALTGSSKQATTLYPGFAGATLILNLPGIVRLLVQFLTPLFPGAVQSRIKFARGPMAYIKDLTDVLKEPTKGMFVSDIEAVLKGL